MKTHRVPLHPFYLLQLAKSLAAVGEKGLGGRRVNASVQAIIQPRLEAYDVLQSPLGKVSPRGLLDVERIRAELTAKHEGDAARAAFDPAWPHLPDPTLSEVLELAPLHLEHVMATFVKWCDMEPQSEANPNGRGPEHNLDRELVEIDEILTSAKKAGPTESAPIDPPKLLP